MATTVVGYRTVSLGRDAEGYRTYKAVIRVASNSSTPLPDGPLTVLQTPGLPTPGSAWSFSSEIDAEVWCRPDAQIKRAGEYRDGDPVMNWDVELTFSNKPLPPSQERCNSTTTGDPLLEPQKVSGTFVKYTEEATYDRFGVAITSSCGEPMRGPQVEFDKSRPTVRIQQNVADLQLGLCAALMDVVNDAPLWGLPARCVKLSQFSWERHFYGSCYVYYTRTFDFDVRYDTFDRTLVDQGTMVLRGHWDTNTASLTYGTYVLDGGVSPGSTSPSDVIRYKDWHGENATVILDGNGRPWDEGGRSTGTSDDTMGTRVVQKYDEANLLLLGIPITF